VKVGKKRKKNSFGDKRKENFLLENGNERVHSEGLCKYGRIILKWMLRECIICLGSALNNILMYPVMNHEFHKFLGKLTS
jgi:hypothetical protein